MIKALGYFWELIKGILITARHFVVNMVFHTLNFVGIRTKRRGAVTIQYPERKKELAARHRSLHRLMKREDGKPRCVACMLCATVCPSECIYIEAAEDPDPEIQKVPGDVHHRPQPLLFLRILRRSLPRRRHPDGHGRDRHRPIYPRRPRLRPRQTLEMNPGPGPDEVRREGVPRGIPVSRSSSPGARHRPLTLPLKRI